MLDIAFEENVPSEAELAALGREQIAYLREDSVDGIDGYAIYSADGLRIGFAVARESADAAVRAHGLEPVSVH